MYWNSEKMDDLSRIHEWGQITRKNYVMITWSVNTDFEFLEKLTHCSSDEMDPHTEWVSMDGPLTMNGRNITIFFETNT